MFSPGKVILSGEHSAVFGESAVAMPIGLGVTCECHPEQIRHPETRPQAEYSGSMFKKSNAFQQNLVQLFAKKYLVDTFSVTLQFGGDLPIGSGLGSSAASANAVFLALAEYFHFTLTDDERIILIQESERFVHGHPSGLDAVTVVKNRPVRFRWIDGHIFYQELPQSAARALRKVPFVLVDSGKPVESTKEMLAIVRERYQTPRDKELAREIGKVTEELLRLCHSESASPPLGGPAVEESLPMDWLTANERLLEELGVVSARAQNMIHQIESVGGMAKITGAGGVTQGSGMLLTYHPDSEKFAHFLNQQAWQFFQINTQ